MKILKNKRNGFTIELEIEEDFSEVEKATEPAFKELVQTVKLPGFRPGKIPRNIFEKNFGNEILLERASTFVMNEAYRKAIEEGKLKPVDYPRDVKVKTFEKDKPFVFTMSVDVAPEVKLHKYKGFKIAKDSAEVKDTDIQAELDRLLESYAEYKDVDRAVQKEDIVNYALKAMDGETPVEMWTREKSGTKVGLAHIAPEFDDELVGMKKGETKKFDIKIKKDHFLKEAAGKNIKFEVTLTDIKERILPELNDEMAKKVSGKETVAELRTEIKDHLEKTRAQDVDSKFREELLKEIIKNNPVELPNAMIETELEAMINNLRNQITNSKLNFEDYLQMMGKNIDQLKEEYKPTAGERVQLRLVLEEIAVAEEIKPSAEDFNKELAKIADSVKKPLEELQKNLSPHLKEHIDKYLIEEKTLEFLVNNAKIK